MKTNQAIDAFGRGRVSSPTTLFNSKQTVDGQPLFWDDAGTGTSAYQSNKSATRLSVTSGQSMVRQTKRRFDYQPGKSQLILITGVFGAGDNNVTKRVGYFDENNGLFFQQVGSTISVGRRSKSTGTPVDTIIPSSDWNIDGDTNSNNYSGSYDFTKSTIFWINYEWLGVGSAQLGVVINGEYVPLHQFNHAGESTEVYMSNPNLPVRYEITSTTGTSSMDAICASVISEGGSDSIGIPLSIDNVTGITTLNDANYYGLFAFRLKSTHLHATVNFNETTIICTSTANYSIRVLLNPTVTGTALSFSDVPGSALQVARPTNATTFSNGTIISSLVGAASSTVTPSEKLGTANQIVLGSLINGTSDIIVFSVSRISGTAETFYGSVNWTEIY
jgi:hypothetical protein